VTLSGCLALRDTPLDVAEVLGRRRDDGGGVVSFTVWCARSDGGRGVVTSSSTRRTRGAEQALRAVRERVRPRST
jgi:hypothetical protein